MESGQWVSLYEVCLVLLTFTFQSMIAELIFASLLVGGAGTAILAHETQSECREVASTLPPKHPSGARCPVRPPGGDEIVEAAILALPEPEDKDFRTLPNSL
jgi:hypothetical protein